MATIKSYTDISQSKKLAKILPLESADMYYTPPLVKGHTAYIPHLKRRFPIDWDIEQAIPCWSLASLLDILPYPQLSKDKLGSGKVGWMVSVYPNDCRYDSCWYDNPIDACVDMVEKLNELKML